MAHLEGVGVRGGRDQHRRQHDRDAHGQTTTPSITRYHELSTRRDGVLEAHAARHRPATGTVVDGPARSSGGVDGHEAVNGLSRPFCSATSFTLSTAARRPRDDGAVPKDRRSPPAPHLAQRRCGVTRSMAPAARARRRGAPRTVTNGAATPERRPVITTGRPTTRSGDAAEARRSPHAVPVDAHVAQRGVRDALVEQIHRALVVVAAAEPHERRRAAPEQRQLLEQVRFTACRRRS